jgi:hypothetical protein
MCRVRPAQPGQKSVITYPLEGLLTVNPGDKRPQEFEFDHVFGPESTQVGSKLLLLACSCSLAQLASAACRVSPYPDIGTAAAEALSPF